MNRSPGSTTGRKVLVAMSGGVDSAVAAALLVQAGHTVVGATMRHFCFRKGDGPEPGGRSCCSLEALDDARRICGRLGIPHHTLDVERLFTRHVVDDFRAEYLRGRTPNPCVRCNRHVRFPVLLRAADRIGADDVATGHYARVERPHAGGPFGLLCGRDPGKDQSYFLWTLDQRTLARTRFPVGERTKRQVRALARDLGIPVAEKADSQEICFLPQGDYRGFIGRTGGRSPALEPGPVVDTDGRELGRHDGTAFYTVGQRRGIGLSGTRAPMYVVELRPQSRTVVVGEREATRSAGCGIEDTGWIAGDAPPFPLRCRVRIRYRHPGVDAVVRPAPGDPGALEARFDAPQEAVTPGQSAVFYDGERVIGGGIIRGPFPPPRERGAP